MIRRLKRFKLYAMFMALIMMISSETPYVFAAENEVSENLPADDMELVSQEDIEVTSEKSLTAEELDVTITGEEPVIYGGEEQVVAFSDDAGSTLYNGTVSGYLSKTGDYALYAVELPAGSYLQARLTVPNNNQIDYELVLYDSEISFIKASDYITFLNETGALAESIGYKAANSETVYLAVFSSNGGSDTEAYTLEFSITTNYSENNEPNENAKEAIALTFPEEASATVSGALNSAIDNDWYSFKVRDNLDYNKIRLDMDYASKTNGYNIEIYKNLSSDYYAMQLVGYGKGGEVSLSAGTYFLRVICTNTLNDFNAADYPTYKLTVSPVGKVDGLAITKYEGYHLASYDFGQGSHYRTMEVLNDVNMITIYGRAYYTIDSYQFPAKNVRVEATIIDNAWEELHPEWVKVHGTAVTSDVGFFQLNIYLNPPRGEHSFINTEAMYPTPHVYDFMELLITVQGNDKVGIYDNFYYECQLPTN